MSSNKDRVRRTVDLLIVLLLAAWLGCSIEDAEDVADKPMLPGEMQPAAYAGLNPEVHLQCVNSECGEILVKQFGDFSEEERQKLYTPRMPPMPGQPVPPRLKCEKCGSDMGRMKSCPSCKAWYMDPMELNFNAKEEICPHCELDVNAYWRQKHAEQQKAATQRGRPGCGCSS